MLEIELYNQMEKDINADKNLTGKESLFQDLFKYSKTNQTLKERHTTIKTEIWRNLGSTDLNKTYVQNGKYFLNDLIIGWIPKDLICLLGNYQKKKNKAKIDKLITKWLDMINKYIYNTI